MHNLPTAPTTGAQDNAALVDLRVRLMPCRACGCLSATITSSNSIKCESCGRKRGRLDHETQQFLHEIVALFGRPTVPIEIRKTSSQPTGAGAATSSSSAPIKEEAL